MNFSLKPYKESDLSKKNQIQKMFDQISDKYDFLNAFLSFGVHKYWRKEMLQLAKKLTPNIVLDIATGTGDLAILLSKKIPNLKIWGLDLSKNMLQLAKKKAAKLVLENKLQFLQGDCEKIPFEAKKFDLITIAFGIRNFENIEDSLREIYRVLKSKGTLIILEFSQPKSPLIRFIYKIYSKYILSNLGKWISKDKSAYNYLYKSAEVFPYGEKMEEILKKAQFLNPKTYPLSFGIVSIYIAKKA